MRKAFHLLRLSALACCLGACVAAAPDAPPVTVRVLLKLKAPARADDPAWVAHLAQLSGAQVSAARIVSPTLAAYQLRCPVHHDGCEPEIARLRASPEIESVSLDAVRHLP